MKDTGGLLRRIVARHFKNWKVEGPTVVIFLAFFFLVFFTPGKAESAEGPPFLLETKWKQIVNRDDILSLEAVDGYLWQGINGGLVVRSLSVPQANRFYHSLNTELPFNRVYDLSAGKDGGLWMGTDSGAVYLEPGGTFEHYHQGNSPLSVDEVRSVSVDDLGGVWLGTWTGGAHYLDTEGKWSTYTRQDSGLPGNSIYQVAPDSNGGAWFATDGEGAAYLSREGEWQVYTSRNSELPVNDVLDIAVGIDGTTWFATPRGLAGYYGEDSWTVDPAADENEEDGELLTTYVQCLETGEDGTLWAGTRDGLVRLSSDGIIQEFTPENSRLPGKNITSLALDERGRTWVGTTGTGLALFEPERDSWKVYRDEFLKQAGIPHLLSNTVNYILTLPEKDGSRETWFCTDRGLVVYCSDEGYWRRPPVPTELIERDMRKAAYHPKMGTVYVTFGDGVFWKTLEGRWEHFTRDNGSLPSDNVTDAVFDEVGGLWLATRGGGAAYRSTDGSWEIYGVEDGLPSDNLNAVTVNPGGEVWLATWDSGAAVMEPGEGDIEIQVFNTANSPLPSNDVSDILFGKDGSVWLATWGGGAALLGSNEEWSIYDAAGDHLPSNEVRALAVDSRSWIWAATPGGAASYDGETWHRYESASSGLVSDDLLGISADEQGNVWFATSSGGLSIFHPEGLDEDMLQMAYPAEKLEEILLVYRDRYLDDEGLSVIEEGRTLVPMRVIAEASGSRVDWDSEESRATISSEDLTLELEPGERQVYVSGEYHELDVPARLVEGRIMVPLRFVIENLGLKVSWDGFLQTVYITN